MTYVDQGATDRALGALERAYAIARAAGDTVNMSADGLLVADVLLEAGRVDRARDRFTRAHQLLAASGADDALKLDDALAAHYDMARVALATGDVASARVDAVAYFTGATARRNDARIRQAHELNGLVARIAKRANESLAELAQADQQNPAVWYAISRAHVARSDVRKAKECADRAEHMNILPTLPYVFTRASLAATRSVTSGSARGTRR